MARLMLVVAIFFAVAGLYVYKGSFKVDNDDALYSGNKTIEMINNLEAPAAGRKD